MTKTELIKLSARTARAPKSILKLDGDNGILICGVYNKRPFYTYHNNQRFIASFYGKVMYCFEQVTNGEAKEIRALYKSLDCNTKVFLYPNSSHIIFNDGQGVYRSREEMRTSVLDDYATVIPIP